MRFTYAVTLSGPKPAHLCTNCVDVLRRGILQAKRVQSPREKRAVQPQHAPKSKVREF
ncbi:MAG: hypothetical protein HKN29_04545 [Rhodothermales bacterium]|nr:hypothetical protein [Rhodothermales bacterium]